jgi:hypothetical protein
VQNPAQAARKVECGAEKNARYRRGVPDDLLLIVLVDYLDS